MNRIRCLSVLTAGIIAASLCAGENDYLRPIGRAREAKAQRRQGGESFPPLPLPATPLRRSEKKRPPSSSVLIGKVVWGSYLDFPNPDGSSTRVFDWNMVPADCQQLLLRLKDATRLEYKSQTVDLATFSGMPAEAPILYFSGGRTIRFTPAERAKLRKYLFDGGMIWFDSVVGSPYFHKGARTEAQNILPECPLRAVDPDHPAYRMAAPTVEETINTGKKEFPPLEGMYLGARLAIVISPNGMGAGWDNLQPTQIPNSKYYSAAGSIRLGINLATYAIGWFPTGQAYASGEAYTETTERHAKGDTIRFAQLKTNGLWNADPGSELKLLRYLERELKFKTGADPLQIDPEKASLEDYPFLYLTGIGAFSLSDNAIRKIRAYLERGGYLFVNNTLGMNEFDASAKRFFAKLFPGSKPVLLTPDHPLYTKGPFRFTSAGLSKTAKLKYENAPFPILLAVEHAGRASVLYSPIDLSGGWTGESRPGAVMYEPETARRLGADIVTYLLTN